MSTQSGQKVCEDKGHKGPLLVAVASVLLFLGFIITLIMAIVKHKRKQ